MRRPGDALDVRVGNVARARGGRHKPDERLVQQEVVHLRVERALLREILLLRRIADELHIGVAGVAGVVELWVERLAIGQGRARGQVSVGDGGKVHPKPLAVIDLVHPGGAVHILQVHLEPDLGEVSLIDLPKSVGFRARHHGVIELRDSDTRLLQQRLCLVKVEGVRVQLVGLIRGRVRRPWQGVRFD